MNAEHDGTVGVVTLGREAYNHDVDAELNRAVDWLKAAGIERVILTGDFHLAAQLVGADTSNFFPALEDTDAGFAVSNDWSKTARRLNDEFAVSVGFINGKRCLGGMLELMSHCHYLVAVDDAAMGFPEVTLPVVPGMEGCHWPFRRTDGEGARQADADVARRALRRWRGSRRLARRCCGHDGRVPAARLGAGERRRSRSCPSSSARGRGYGRTHRGARPGVR